MYIKQTSFVPHLQGIPSLLSEKDSHMNIYRITQHEHQWVHAMMDLKQITECRGGDLKQHRLEL